MIKQRTLIQFYDEHLYLTIWIRICDKIIDKVEVSVRTPIHNHILYGIENPIKDELTNS